MQGTATTIVLESGAIAAAPDGRRWAACLRVLDGAGPSGWIGFSLLLDEQPYRRRA